MSTIFNKKILSQKFLSQKIVLNHNRGGIIKYFLKIKNFKKFFGKNIARMGKFEEFALKYS
jgi:hypothetical protein